MKKICCIIILLLTVVIVVTTGKHNYNKVFTIQKWKENPSQRSQMLNDLVEKKQLIGMNESEITNLLGSSEKPRKGEFSSKIGNQSFELENSLVYYLGEDLLESKWLVVSMEKDVCVGYTVAVN